MNKKNTSFNVAYCGIMCALAVIVMFAALIPGLVYVAPSVAGFMVWTVSSQISPKWGWLCFFASAVLIFILVPQFEANCYYIALLGYYPLLRDVFMKLKNRAVRFLVKMIVFNVTVVAAFKVTCAILGTDAMLEGLDWFGEFAVYALWAMANIAFLSYDYALRLFFTAYEKLLKPKLKRRMK
ncbi:hypothetical protein FACS189499_04340 [Clostridia bacterium]|nr:hypothetical protein FACS189499_04340 [Clostridia bacterium]